MKNYFLQACEEHLNSEGLKTEVEEHYRAVVRALIAESVDLTYFLQKVEEDSEFVTSLPELLSSEQDIHMLQRTDWVRAILS